MYTVVLYIAVQDTEDTLQKFFTFDDLGDALLFQEQMGMDANIAFSDITGDITEQGREGY